MLSVGPILCEGRLMNVSAQPLHPLVPSESIPMSFSGQGRAFLKLLVAGSLFQIPTFGFYRFWLVTKVRRHLWANTRIDGEAFEYTGTAKELLIGFLIALAVLTPLYIMTFIASIMIEEAKAFASLPLALIMYVLAHFGVYRARKYRASRTGFRGVRFWMKGSGWAYALRAILWDLAVLLSLGLALPWAMASLERYRIRHTYFGSIQGSFVGTGWSLFKRGWWIWLTGLIVVAGIILIFLAKSALAIMFFPMLFLAFEGARGGAFIGATLMAGYMLFAAAVAIFKRWSVEGICFGELTCSSSLSIRSMQGLFCKLVIAYIAFALIVAIGAGITIFSFKDFFRAATQALDHNAMSETVVWVILMGVAVYLVLMLGLGVIQRYFLGRGLWVAVVSTTAVTNLHTLDAALAGGEASGTLGEGLADALDFGVGL
jgi:uncharacterized membrane protein YjgN (DUF898 family)